MGDSQPKSATAGRAGRAYRNALVLMVSRFSQPVLSVLLVLAVARLLGPDGMGQYSAIIAYLFIFQVISSFGLNNLLAREVARKPELAGKYLVNSGVFAAALGVVAQVVMVGLAPFLEFSGATRAGVTIVSFALVANALIACFEGVLAGRERIQSIGLVQFIENVVRVGASLALLWLGFGILPLMGAVLAARLLSLAVYVGVLRGGISLRGAALEWRFVKGVVDQGKVFAATMLFVTIYWRLDIMMLQKMRTEAEVGWYGAAYRLLQMLMIIPQSIMYALFPAISSFFENEQDAYRATCARAAKLLMLATLPLAVLLATQSEHVILLLYGAKYLPSVEVLRLLSWTLAPYGLTLVFAYGMLAARRQSYDFMVNVVATVANGALNYLLIPKYGITGAAAATLISIFVYLALQAPMVITKLFRVPAMNIIKPALAGGVMLALVVWLSGLHFVIVSILGIAAYVAAILMLKTMTAEEMAYLQGVWGKVLVRVGFRAA